jgi:hypothetical protein
MILLAQPSFSSATIGTSAVAPVSRTGGGSSLAFSDDDFIRGVTQLCHI